MWFGTEDGLNKFDGSKFAVYRHVSGDTTSLQANEILYLHEDKSGNLWVGTGGGGLSLYDRQKDAFINFISNGKANSIRNNVIRSIASDYQGNIWLAHYAGIDIIDPKTKEATAFKNDSQHFFEKTSTYLFEDSKHNMWIGTNDGLFCYRQSSNSVKKYTHTAQNPESISGNSIYAIVEDINGNIWIGTEGGLSRLQPNKETFNSSYNLTDPSDKLTNGGVNSLAIGEQNQLWIGTPSGLNILDIPTGKVTHLRSDSKDAHSLTISNVVSLYNDHQGIFWIGTYRRGVNKYDQNLTLFPLIQGNSYDEQGLHATTVNSFAEDNEGKIFIGTEEGGIALFDPKKNSFRHYNLYPRENNTGQQIAVLALKRTRDNQLYIGTYANGLFVLDPVSGNYQQIANVSQSENLNAKSIFCILEDHLGKKWIGTNGSGISILNAENKVEKRLIPSPLAPNDRKLPINGYIRDLVEDKDGTVWIATHGGGIANYDPATENFIIYSKANSNISSDKVQSILIDRQGNLLVGTLGGGLCLLNKKTGQFTIYSEKEGLQNNNIRKIVEDNNGTIWVSSDRGLSSVDLTSKSINNYNYLNGIQHNNFIHGSGLCSSDGTLYFGGMEGFNYFSPQFIKKNKNVPAVLITDLKVSNQSITPSEEGPLKENISLAIEINLDYKQNFTLSFVGLNYTAPEQNNYAYKLEGFDKDWNYVGNTTTASYTNLDPGEYTFKVIASNNDGVWNKEGKSIKIFVHPPFWRTGIAYFFYLLSLGGILLYIRHRGIKKLKDQFAAEQLKTKLNQQQQEAERTHELDQQKIKFLTNLSHEFRTPISLIVGPTETLLAQGGNERQTGQLQLIKRNGKRLLNLVNQLLDFRKMEEHELTLQSSDGEFVSFVKEVTDSFRDLSEKKKIELVFNSNFDELYTRFDHDKVERILFNLLSNAFKFTLNGGMVSLLVSKDEDLPNEEKTWITLQISDTGIGIPQEQQDKIFERFFQHTTAGAILNQGTGIGLSITKEFVEMQGGTIAVQSEPGKGTQFTVRLPFVPIPAPTKIELAPVFDTAKKQSSVLDDIDEIEPISIVENKQDMSSILIIEDNEDFRYYLKDNLQLHYKVYEAGNGKEGWQKALAQHPNLIVSDVSMPYMDGIELCKKLKSDKRTSHIPVILLTALTAEQDQLKGLEIGANDYITKPFNFDVLNIKVKNLMTLNTSLKNTYTKQIKVLAPEIKIESSDEKLMDSVMRYIEENLTDSQLSVEELSKNVNMSRSSLYNKLLELTGQTPVEFIRSVKLEKAAVLLEKSDQTIAQVAYSVGFSTPNYFTKSFKAKYNMLPSEYVQKKKEENKQNGNEPIDGEI